MRPVSGPRSHGAGAGDLIDVLCEEMRGWTLSLIVGSPKLDEAYRDALVPVARRYGVEQARNRVLVLVSLTEGEAPQTAAVTGQARDLRGVAQALSFREVQTDGFIDYVAVATATPPDTLRFELDVADTSGQRTTLRFSRDLAP